VLEEIADLVHWKQLLVVDIVGIVVHWMEVLVAGIGIVQVEFVDIVDIVVHWKQMLVVVDIVGRVDIGLADHYWKGTLVDIADIVDHCRESVVAGIAGIAGIVDIAGIVAHYWKEELVVGIVDDWMEDVDWCGDCFSSSQLWVAVDSLLGYTLEVAFVGMGNSVFVGDIVFVDIVDVFGTVVAVVVDTAVVVDIVVVDTVVDIEVVDTEVVDVDVDVVESRRSSRRRRCRCGCCVVLCVAAW